MRFPTLGDERAYKSRCWIMMAMMIMKKTSIFPGYCSVLKIQQKIITPIFLNTEGNIFERYKKFNGLEGNSPETFTETNRGSTTQPDARRYQ